MMFNDFSCGIPLLVGQVGNRKGLDIKFQQVSFFQAWIVASAPQRFLPHFNSRSST